MSEHKSVPDCALISTDRATDNIVEALKHFMGRGEGKQSYEDVEFATGIDAKTLYSYVRTEQRRGIPGASLLRLCQYFGPEFTSKVLSGTGQGGHYLEPQPGEPAYVIARLALGTGLFAELGADHRYCHIDNGKLEPVASEMIQILQPFAQGRGE